MLFKPLHMRTWRSGSRSCARSLNAHTISVWDQHAQLGDVHAVQSSESGQHSTARARLHEHEHIRALWRLTFLRKMASCLTALVSLDLSPSSDVAYENPVPTGESINMMLLTCYDDTIGQIFILRFLLPLLGLSLKILFSKGIFIFSRKNRLISIMNDLVSRDHGRIGDDLGGNYFIFLFNPLQSLHDSLVTKSTLRKIGS